MTSILENVSPLSLDEIFNTDPNLFTGPDDPRVVKVVEALRADRAKWLEAEQKSKVQKTAVTKETKLEDLGL